jgi:hypothetical protein
MTTTRAYTIKLTGSETSDTTNDTPEWRRLLWKTHVTANRGVQVWGDWLLTLRGGLPAALVALAADGSGVLPVTEKEVEAALKDAKIKGKAKTERSPQFKECLIAERRDNLRILLALSWLSVEAVDPRSTISLPHVVASADDDTQVRVANVLAAFEMVLSRKGVPVGEHESWLNSCRESLSARIRDDGCWVDRSASFEDLVRQCNGELTIDWASRTFFDLFGGRDEYFTLLEDGGDSDGKDFVIKAGNWLSANWGAGEKSDPATIGKMLHQLSAAELCSGQTSLEALRALAMIAAPSAELPDTAESAFKLIKQAVGWKGRSSKGAMALKRLLSAGLVDGELAELVATKFNEESQDRLAKSADKLDEPAWMPIFRERLTAAVGMPYRVNKDLIWEHAVLLDHALRRTSVAHSWIKRAEMERREFRDDANLLADSSAVPVAACEWLDRYCDRRGIQSGSLDGYIISKRAIDGWKLVVDEWKSNPSMTAEQRRQAVRDVQANLDRDDKWGDSRLFEDLAVDEALSVWHEVGGKVTASILRNYVAATTARSNQRRFKVPAYRHPDPMMNPVWVDFGNSRWSISYSALSEYDKRSKLQQKLQTAKTDKARKKYADALSEPPDLKSVTLGLWTGSGVEKTVLKWHGKRLENDLDLPHFHTSGPSVVRADRLSRAAAKSPDDAVNVVGVFQQKDWNGRLQLKRPKLERLCDRLRKQGITSDDPADWGALQKHFDRLNWYLTTSAKLEPSGPFIDYRNAGLADDWKYVSKVGYLSNTLNKTQKRSGRTRIQLARLPGLRLLSFDLGHRYGASCAVWETVTTEQLQTACKAADVKPPDDAGLFFVLQQPKAEPRTRGRRVVYRRLAADQLGGMPHPAPWARLDRQFVIRLQGEDESPRRATSEEFDRYNDLRNFLDLEPITAKEELELAGVVTRRPPVIWLMQEAVRDARLGLRRLSDRARIAHAMTANEKVGIGGRADQLDSEYKRREHVLDALLLWNDLAKACVPIHANVQRCPFAYQLWLDHIQSVVSGKLENCHNEDDTRPARKKKRETLRTQLSPAADLLVDSGSPLARQLHRAWADNWADRDAHWKTHLRWLRRGLMMPKPGRRPVDPDSPEFAIWQQRRKLLKNRGGLSYDRIGAMRQLYQVMKAYHNKPTPEDLLAGVLDRNDRSQAKFGRRMLDQFERLREQRVKQLASRIIEAALGLGAEAGRDQQGHQKKRQRMQCDDPRFAPCHAVIMEDLSGYRTEETRMRRENRMLARWAASTVKKYITEACELHGVYFDTVPAQYTSKQDSRSASPGVRCSEVPRVLICDAIGGRASTDTNDVTAHRRRSDIRRWKNEFERAEKRVAENKAKVTIRDRLLVAVSKTIKENPEGLPSQILIPVRGGDLFLPAVDELPLTERKDSASKQLRTIQADLNAGANVGLVAVLDPDFSGTWWRVKVMPSTGRTQETDYPGSPLFEEPLELLSAEQRTGKRDRQNAFCFPSTARLSSDERQWWTQLAFMNHVESLCCRRIAESMGLELQSD